MIQNNLLQCQDDEIFEKLLQFIGDKLHIGISEIRIKNEAVGKGKNVQIIYEENSNEEDQVTLYLVRLENFCSTGNSIEYDENILLLSTAHLSKCFEGSHQHEVGTGMMQMFVFGREDAHANGQYFSSSFSCSKESFAPMLNAVKLRKVKYLASKKHEEVDEKYLRLSHFFINYPFTFTSKTSRRYKRWFLKIFKELFQE